MAIEEYFTVHPRAKAPRYYKEGYTLDDVYTSYSPAKREAFDYCKWLCEEMNGYGFAIRSHNTFSFTVNFYFQDYEAGRTMLAIITHTYNHAYYL